MQQVAKNRAKVTQRQNDWQKAKLRTDAMFALATAESEQDIIALNHHTNLRPMWAIENIAKGAKVLTLV